VRAYAAAYLTASLALRIEEAEHGLVQAELAEAALLELRDVLQQPHDEVVDGRRVDGDQAGDPGGLDLAQVGPEVALEGAHRELPDLLGAGALEQAEHRPRGAAPQLAEGALGQRGVLGPHALEVAAGVLLGLVVEDVVEHPGVVELGVVVVGAQEVDGGVDVGGREALTDATQVAPRAADQVAHRAARDLLVVAGLGRVGGVEAGREGAEDLAVAAGLGLFEDLLEPAPRTPAQRDLADHVEQRGALVGAASAPQLDEHGVQLQARRQRDLGARSLERPHRVDAVAGAHLRGLALELVVGELAGEAGEAQRPLARRLRRARIRGSGHADNQTGQIRIPAVPRAADVIEAEFKAHCLLPVDASREHAPWASPVTTAEAALAVARARGLSGAPRVHLQAAYRDINRVMMTPKASWSLFSVLVGALALSACKKDGDAKPPEDGGSGDVADSGGGDGGGGGGGDEPDEAEFLTVDVFEETLQSKTDDVAECFGKAKESKPDLGGTLMLDFTVGGDGVVTEVKTDPASTIKDDGLNACVLEKAKTWKFPKTRKGEPMTLPFKFSMG
jgi:hypothetical protein